MSRRKHRHTPRWNLANLAQVNAVSERMTKEHPMRKLEFPSGTRPKTKTNVSALAWATNRRGRVPWKSTNVTTQVSEYLAECGFVLAPIDVAYVMQWAEKNKYGYRRTLEGGKRTLEFSFLPDVDLSNHSAEGLTRINKPGPPPPDAATKAGVERLVATKNGIAPHTQTAVLERPATHVDTPPALPVIDVPIPGAPAHPPVYRMDELNELLTRWSDANPDAYAEWVERSIAQLSAVLG